MTLWQTILSRLKSPVVIGQIIVAGFAFASAMTGESYESLANTLVLAVSALYAVFAALNNPTTPDKF